MFSNYVELYRGNDEHHYEELCALLLQAKIKNRTQIARPDSKVAAMYGSAGAYPGTPNTRYGYMNQSSFFAEKELERTETADKLYTIHVREKDFPRAAALIRKTDEFSNGMLLEEEASDILYQDSLNFSPDPEERIRLQKKKRRSRIPLLISMIATVAVVVLLLFTARNYQTILTSFQYRLPASNRMQQAVASFAGDSLSHYQSYGEQLTGQLGYTRMPVYRMVDGELKDASLQKQYWLLFSDDTPVCFLTVYESGSPDMVYVVFENWNCEILQGTDLEIVLVEKTTGNPAGLQYSHYTDDPDYNKSHCFCLYLSDGSAVPYGGITADDDKYAVALSDTLMKAQPVVKWVPCKPKFRLKSRKS